MTPAQTRVQISGAIETKPSQHGPQTLAGNCAIVPVSSRAVVTCWLNRVCGGPFGRLTDGDICCRTLPYPTIISNDEPSIWPEVLHTQEPIQNRGTPRRQRGRANEQTVKTKSQACKSCAGTPGAKNKAGTKRGMGRGWCRSS